MPPAMYIICTENFIWNIYGQNCYLYLLNLVVNLLDVWQAVAQHGPGATCQIYKIGQILLFFLR